MAGDRTEQPSDEGTRASFPRRAWRRSAVRAARLLVEAGLPPALAGWRHVRRVAPAERLRAEGREDRIETVHPEATADNPLPRNVPKRAELDPDPVWFGFSFRDVPERRLGPTRLLNVGPARVICYGGPGRPEEFHPVVLAPDGAALELDQMIFRMGHARRLRAPSAQPPQRRARAIWVLERVYDNHSHWLTSHLPKVALLKRHGLLADMILPHARTTVMDESMRMLGVDPESLPMMDTDRPLEVEELVMLETDRFRPELLRPVRDALAPPTGAAAHRRVFISREGARARRLLGEAALRPALEDRGFEIVRMEDLSFAEQVRLMSETAVLIAPHGAGLTNMMFCPEGSQVAEIADPGYPNPNFYALACAMGLGYRLLPAEASGEGHRLWRDLRPDPDAVLAAADAMISEVQALSPGGAA